ncbi:hypothetical protein DLAC_03504 [Tieghemostelium lacteum]|uniref:Uncharacterized protein n=1 Tax=Tieghemostelium lacteum TaxID=361077 RepID=A0A152A1D4_TIELA|nr:hypothetical protein DLAC_03504 [Tieghemostelium lacteum]|eukprot:KYR00009.1 hypothetical protein DLAC_03504 [Tieghemostelium lacteum]
MNGYKHCWYVNGKSGDENNQNHLDELFCGLSRWWGEGAENFSENDRYKLFTNDILNFKYGSAISSLNYTTRRTKNDLYLWSSFESNEYSEYISYQHEIKIYSKTKINWAFVINPKKDWRGDVQIYDASKNEIHFSDYSGGGNVKLVPWKNTDFKKESMYFWNYNLQMTNTQVPLPYSY